jgi:molecular chaperone GrpE (heat shock protein)
VADDGVAGLVTATAQPVESQSTIPAEAGTDVAISNSTFSLLSSALKEQQSGILNALSPIVEELTLLREEFAKRLAYDDTKENAFSRLYQEMDLARAEQKLQQFRPIYLDLILLLDRIELNHANVVSCATFNGDFASILKSLSDEILEILFRGEVEPLTQLTTKFDPASQRAVGVEAAREQHEHHDVAHVVRRGFKFRSHVLRAEEVVIKKFG